MAQYRKKPVVIEAEQFFYDGPRVRGVFYPDLSSDGRTWEGDAFVITIHDQRVYLQSGDWIIPEPDGEHYYPVKPDIFAATYEAVEGDMFARGEMATDDITVVLTADDIGSETAAALAQMVDAAVAMVLRRQLAHMTQWRDSAIVDGNAARAEAAELRQLAALPDLVDRYGQYCCLCGAHGITPFEFDDWLLKGEPYDLDSGGVAELQPRR